MKLLDKAKWVLSRYDLKQPIPIKDLIQVISFIRSKPLVDTPNFRDVPKIMGEIVNWVNKEEASQEVVTPQPQDSLEDYIDPIHNHIIESDEQEEKGSDIDRPKPAVKRNRARKTTK